MSELRFAVTPIIHVDVRDTSANDDNTWTMSGTAAVFNQSTILFDSKFIRLSESIDPDFFDPIMRDQPLGEPEGVVHFNFGHDMNRAVASTNVPAGEPGSLALSVNKDRGLDFLAKVPRDDPDGVALAVKMRHRVVNQASFAFTVADGGAEYTLIEAEEGPDEEHRRLLRAGHLYDVCACAQGAYPQTVAGLRSYAAAIGQPTISFTTRDGVGYDEVTIGEARPISPDVGGGIAVSPETGGGVVTVAHLERQLAMQRARSNGYRPIR